MCSSQPVLDGKDLLRGSAHMYVGWTYDPSLKLIALSQPAKSRSPCNSWAGLQLRFGLHG